MPSSDDQELITVDSKRNTTLFTILLCLHPRKEETRAPKKKKEKKRRKRKRSVLIRSLICCFLRDVCDPTHVTPGPLVVVPIYSQLTLLYFVCGRKMYCNDKEKKTSTRSFASLMPAIAYHTTDDASGRRKPRVSVVRAVRVYCA
jgi:hypothetical protein